MKEKKGKWLKAGAYDIAMVGVMVAVIEVCKWALSFLPNVELTSFWLILFTLFFGWKIVFVVPVFILVEGAVYGIGLWWIMYLYAWPLLVLIAYLFRKTDSPLFWAILSGLFGLLFGALCAIPYFFIGMSGSGGISAGFHTAVAWWIAGIPFDFVHCAGNFVLMLLLYVPMTKVMKKIKKSPYME